MSSVGSRIRIRRIHMFLGLLDPDPDPLSELWIRIRILPFYRTGVEKGTRILTFFDKMEPPRLLKVDKLNFKKHLRFWLFLSRFVRVWL
jgi:hypothetical protein